MAQNSVYLSQYKELEIIGRGNFGSATLVQSLEDNIIYVAKKVVLGGLSQKEQDGANLEVRLLKELKHPHIVEYKDSFIENGMLIIIMEYCEEGDLAYFIKKRAQKQEFLDEKLVLNWFLQLLLALEFVHRKKILHRDIKSSNIFLRSNGTVKLGDFGISRVLENTHEAAMTVVGTPYYMSPEVCENKPYTFKSDVWALGCVLYEMCTLKHAFSASNLLGLVYKIVREKHEPIPKLYSPELSTLVQKLLIKNVQGRPGIRDIFMEHLIQKTIEEFIRSDGQYTTMLKIPVKKTQLHKQQSINDVKELPNTMGTIGQATVSNNNTMVSFVAPNGKAQLQQPNSAGTKPNYDNETPQQRMARKKEEQRKEQEEKMKNAARESLMARNQDKQRKNKELQGNISIIPTKQEPNKTMSKMEQQSPSYPNQYTQQQQQYYNQSSHHDHYYGGGGNEYSQPQQQYYPQYGGGGGQSNYEMMSPSFPQKNQGQNTMNNFSRVSQTSAFAGNDSYDHMKQGFEQTNQSLSYSQSNGSLSNKSGFSMANNQYASPNYNQGGYGYNNVGGYGIKENSGHSVYSIRTEYDATSNNNNNNKNYPEKKNYYHDERPLPTLANRTNSKGATIKNADDNYEDEYEEDFEEYWSDEEDTAPKRLTLKATKKDLSDVVDLYKEKLNAGKNNNNYYSDNDDLKDTTCETLSKSQKISGMSSTREAQINILKNRTMQALGQQQFEQAYSYLKKQRELGTSDKKIQEELGNMVGKKNLALCFDIDQLIFLESM